MHVSQHQPSTGPEGSPNGRRSLYVPVRRGPAGGVVIRLWRTPVGTRTAVAFTSDRLLRSVLGPTQVWIRLSEAALRRMAEPLGATYLTIDPLLTARAPAAWSSRDEQATPGTAAGTRPPGPAPTRTWAPRVDVPPTEVTPAGADAPDTGVPGTVRDALPTAPETVREVLPAHGRALGEPPAPESAAGSAPGSAAAAT
jgi:hypothetical protein